jgi:branched-chain amino acid transport system permease protein
MSEFFQQLVNGITVGSVYALIALGYTMVYGILMFINFAHGEIYMFGGFIAWVLMIKFGIHFIPSALITVAAVSCIGVIIEKIAYRPLRYASRLGPLITAIGVSIFLQNLAALIFGTDPRPFPIPEWLHRNIYEIKGVILDSLQIWIFSLSVIIMIGLDLYVNHTRMGKAMRATKINKQVASLMGINLDTVISLVFAIGSGIAAIGGLMVGMYYNAVYPTMGFMPGLVAFTAAVLGGIGNIRGAMIGGMLIGILENLGAAYISSGFKQAIAFLILIFLLLFRQEGIMGKVEREKV